MSALEKLQGDSSLRRLSAVGLSLASLTSLPERAEAEDVAVSKIPPKVRDAAARVAPKVKWSSAELDQADDQDVYELTGKDGKGQAVILEVSADGKVLESRAEVAVAKVPKDVWKVVAEKFPKFEAMTAYALREGDDLRGPDDGELSYEVSGTYSDDLLSILEISADGTISELEQQLAPADLPEAVSKAVRDKMPMFKVTTAYELSQDGEIVGYQLSGKRGKGKQAKELDLFVSAEGDVQIDE